MVDSTEYMGKAADLADEILPTLGKYGFHASALALIHILRTFYTDVDGKMPTSLTFSFSHEKDKDKVMIAVEYGSGETH